MEHEEFGNIGIHAFDARHEYLHYRNATSASKIIENKIKCILFT